jgi:chaperonin GroES
MAKTKFRPLHDRVVVKRIDAEEKTKGGIIIPDSAKEKPSQGEITAVGPGGRDEAGKLIPIDLKVGDRVLFGKWSGTEVKIEGEDVLIMKESDIMGVLAEASRSDNQSTTSRLRAALFFAECCRGFLPRDSAETNYHSGSPNPLFEDFTCARSCSAWLDW